MKSERNRECIGAAHAGLWCAVFFLLLGSHQVRAQSAVGVVSEIAGTARIARGGANLTVSKGTAVLPWDKLKAEAQSSLTITLNNGGNIALEGPLEFLVDVSDSLEPATSIPAGLLRKNSGHTGASTFKASAMGLRAERTRLAFDSFGAIGGLHPRRVRERVGSVLKVNGTTHVTKAASITLVHEGTPIDAGDVLTTDTGASLTLVISDQSAIDLGDRTQLVAGARTDIPGAAQEEVDRSSFFSEGRQRVLQGEQAITAITAVLACVYIQRAGGGERREACDNPLGPLINLRRFVNRARSSARSRRHIQSKRIGKIIGVAAGYQTNVRGTEPPSPPVRAVSTEPCRP
jgi:hypothetical protein